MKIVIISDSHDQIPHIDLVLGYCHSNDIDHILHCGDICKPDTLDYLVKKWHKPFDFVFGNGDIGRPDMKECAQHFEHVTCHGELGVLEIDNIKIAFNHYPEVATELAYKNDDIDFIFYGHTHKPWMKETNNTIMANPGPIAGMIYDTSFAVLDTSNKHLGLVLLKDLLA